MKKTIFQRDYSESMITDEDIVEFLALLAGSPSLTQKNRLHNGKVNRAFTKALFCAEELHGCVRLEADGDEFSLTITK